jgi:cytochrome c oxidase subunit IV
MAETTRPDRHDRSDELVIHAPAHEGTYFLVFIVLAVLTLIELVLTYTPEAVRYPALVILMILKAVLVVTFYMHLRWEKRFYIVIIAFPMAIAALAALAVQQLVR